jgi:glutamate-ammonia-ligase adenylyltransferase
VPETLIDLRDRLLLDAAGGPDPDEAPTRIARFADAAVDLGGLDACVPDEEAARLVTTIAAQSPYLMAPLVRDPRRLAALARDPFLAREKDAAIMRAELAAEPGTLDERLRRYRNREYLRLGARELGWGPGVAVARELAHLADVCLEAALAEILAELAARHGEPRTSDGRRCRFVVFGMGKLGGEELNFSSDIDLLYL